MSKIILLQSQNERIKKQNENLQKENTYLREKLDRVVSIAIQKNIKEIKDELREYYEL